MGKPRIINIMSEDIIFKNLSDKYKDNNFILKGSTGEVRSLYNRICDLNSIRKSYLNNNYRANGWQLNNDLLQTWNLRSLEEINERLGNYINELIYIETQNIKLNEEQT